MLDKYRKHKPMKVFRRTDFRKHFTTTIRINMKYFALIILLSSNLFSQKIVIPVEKKFELSRTDKNYEEYVFKDINNVFEKFLGKWFFKDELYRINLEVFRQFDKDNRQDAILIELEVIKNNDTIISALPNLITGGVFEEKNNLNKIIVFFSEISDTWQCGKTSQVNLTFDNDILIWEIDDRQLRYNKTVRLFPKIIKFKRQ